MLNISNGKKIDNIIREKFNIILEYKFKGLLLLYGGAIRNIITGTEIRDLDFVILTQGKCEILDFIKKYNLRHKINALGGYKIFYNDIEIDMFTTNDLLDAATYDVDLLFYDLHEHIFIPCGPLNSYKTRKITEINNAKEPLIYDGIRLKKLIRYVKTITKSKKKVKVKRNKLYWKYKMLKKKLKLLKIKILNGNFRKCFIFLNGCKNEFKLIIFLGIMIAIISALTPALSGNLITKIIYGGYSSVVFVIIAMVTLKLISILLSFYLSKLYLFIRKKMVFNIRKEISSRVLNLAMDNFNNNNRGTFINKIKDDPNEIARTFNKIKDILISGLGNFGVLFYIFYLNFRIGLILLVFMFIIFKVRMIGIRKRMLSRKEFFKEQERYSSMLGEMINGMNDIKVLNLKNNYHLKAVESFENAQENEYKGDYYQNVYNKFASFIEFIAIGVIVIYGIFLIQRNLLAPSQLIIIYMYKSSVFAFLDRLTTLMDLRADFNLACLRIFSLLDDNVFTKESFGKKEKNSCLGVVEFRSVNFKYADNYILKNCTFKVNKNETIAIVGKSGSGKTTILNLIAKTYKVLEGNIFIDNIDINELSESYIRDNISIISQSPYLFDMSIKDNLRLVKEDITDEEIVKACKKACIHSFIESLPNKYDTLIGEGGLRLSGGQKQRLGIARALVKNTKIILLDEITSALDNDTGTLIKKVIENIKKDHTLIIVTHELSMLKDCSKILVLDSGKIAALGSHDKLIENNQSYKKLYKLK